MLRRFLLLLLVALAAGACILAGGQTPTEISPTETAASSGVSTAPTAVAPTEAATVKPSPKPTQIPTPASTRRPTEVPPPTPSATPKATLTSTERELEGPDVSYHGISFTVDPVLGDAVFADTAASGPPGYAEFSFAPGGWCRATGCVIVYPVEAYREDIPFGDDLIDGLEAVIEDQSDDYFPVLAAHILLRAQTQHIRFQNGSGIRAAVIAGQDFFFANNESMQYEFHGLTDDGQYYIQVMFPIAAPMLLSTYDPARNTNEDAIPVPELPEDDRQASIVINEYNEEAERQLEALDGSSFAPDLGALDALVDSLQVVPVGTLEVDIDYNGTWFTETFSYTREAENIRHFVLVMPESRVDEATADDVFSSIDFLADSDVLSVREGREAFAWTLDYVYEAPEGRFRGQFPPGVYHVAAAIVAAPISKEEAGAPDDAIFWAGMSGGGVSTGYQRKVIELRENTVRFSLADWHDWACPWLYAFNGRSFERRTEILRNVRGKHNEQMEVSHIGTVEVVDGSVILKVAEEKAEVTFIDALYVVVDGVKVRAEADPRVTAKVTEKDRDYLLVNSGESFTFRFRLPDSLAGRKQVDVAIVVSGYYESQE
jgi:hypothetical protein